MPEITTHKHLIYRFVLWFSWSLSRNIPGEKRQYIALPLWRDQFSPKSALKTPNGRAMGCLVDSNFDLYSTLVIAVSYVISCSIGPSYNGTRLYSDCFYINDAKKQGITSPVIESVRCRMHSVPWLTKVYNLILHLDGEMNYNAHTVLYS